MKALWRPLLGVAIGVGFVIFIQRYVGWQALLAPWANLPLQAIGAAALLTLLSYWLRALRFYDYFPADMTGRFSLCTRLMLQHNLLNNLLPMRTGELSFPVLMARYFGVAAARSLPALLWFRLMDLHSLGIFALVAFAGTLWPASAGLAVLFAWVPLPWLAFHYSNRLHRRLDQHDRRAVARWLRRLLEGFPRQAEAFWRAWGWTFINWLVKLGVFAWVLQWFLPVPYRTAVFGAIAGDLTSVLPIHGVAGAGTYEAGVMAGLLPYGVAAQPALAAAVNLHLFLLGTTLAGGGVSLFIGGARRG